LADTDPAIIGYMPLEAASAKDATPDVLTAVRYGAGVAGALLVLAVGKVLARRQPAAA
jgi:hypothetical protein